MRLMYARRENGDEIYGRRARARLRNGSASTRDAKLRPLFAVAVDVPPSPLPRRVIP